MLNHHFSRICFSIFVLLLAGLGELKAQINNPIALFCDRNIYLSGENIYFNCIIDSLSNAENTVIYLDLVSASGFQLNGKKYLVKRSNSLESSFQIPDNLASGSYFLRTYTRQNRNFGQENFAALPIKIINIHKQPITAYSNYKAVKPSYSSNNICKDFSIKTLNDSIAKNDSTTIYLDLNSSEKKYRQISVSVVPEKSVFFCDSCEIRGEAASESLFSNESVGIHIDGKIIDQNTKQGIKNANLFLSYPNKKNIFPSYTDSLGKFSINIPHYQESGKLILALEERNSQINPEFQINKEFEQIPDFMAFPEFLSSESEADLFLKMAQNAQINGIFGKNQLYRDSLNSFQAGFYGKDDISIFLSDYISLPSLTDYFTEIDLDVKLDKSNGQLNFRIKGEQAELAFYKPLVLVDYVFVNNTSELRNISPVLISHIEVVNSLYLKGEFIFGGIINFITKANDFGGLKFSESTITFDYDFIINPTHEEINIPQSKPDARNTLFWQSFSVNGRLWEEKITLKTGQTSGNFLIYVQLLDADGNISYAFKNITIY